MLDRTVVIGWLDWLGDLLLRTGLSVAVGMRPQFLTTWVFSWGCLSLLVAWHLACLLYTSDAADDWLVV